jgi:hypothetical protein
MSLQNLNWLAIIVAGVVYFIIGALWYSPLLFANLFMKYRGLTSEEIRVAGQQPIGYLFTLIGDLVAAVALAIVLQLAQPAAVTDGIAVGLLVAVGFIAPTIFAYTLYSGPRIMLRVMYSGYMLVAFAIMGTILTLWR